MNAAVDSRQASVLDFFGTKGSKAQSGMHKTDSAETSMSTVNISMATDDAGTSTATSTCSSVNSSGTPGPSKPWPLKSHATSKAGNSSYFSGFPHRMENLEKWENIFHSETFELTGKVREIYTKYWRSHTVLANFYFYFFCDLNF